MLKAQQEILAAQEQLIAAQKSAGINSLLQSVSTFLHKIG